MGRAAAELGAIGSALMEAAEVVTTMAPPCEFFAISGMIVRRLWIVASNCADVVRPQSTRSVSAGFAFAALVLTTAQSRRPYWFWMKVAACVQRSMSVTSKVRVETRSGETPAASSSSATTVSAASSMSARRSPPVDRRASSAAQPAPMPEPAPVMSVTGLSRICIGGCLWRPGGRLNTCRHAGARALYRGL